MNLAFDFGKISSQGAYFSFFTPSSLADYLNDPVVPQKSRYHMVGCCPGLLPILIKMDSLHLVQRYIEDFRFRKTVIDLCLPYYDSRHHRSYMGRFIIYGGKLLGIRLSTGANVMFSIWPRYKVVTASLKINQRQTHTVLIGQFGLNLTNVRIGLLFDSQLCTVTNEYINCCFDVIALTRVNWSDDAKIEVKRNKLAMGALLIETSLLRQFSLLGQEQLRSLEIGDIKREKNIIFMDYYEFGRVFANKKWLKLQKIQKLAIQSLQIDLYLSQQQQILGNICDGGLYTIISARMSLLLSNSPLPQDKKHYLGRMLTLLSFTQGKKIIAVIDESPTSICFFYMLKHLFSNASQSLKTVIDSYFTFLIIGGQKLDLLLQRIDIIDPSKHQKIEMNNFSSMQCSLLYKIDQILSQINQEWISVIGNNLSLKSVIELINKRTFQKEKSECDDTVLLQTCLMCEFFSFQQLVSLYFSQQVKRLVANDQYWLQIWQKHQISSISYRTPSPASLDQVIDLSLTKFQLSYQLGKVHIQPMLRFSNALLYWFQLWMGQIEENNSGLKSCLRKEKFFCHFLFREIGVIKSTFLPSSGQYTANFVEELMALPKELIVASVSLFRESDLSSRIRLQHNFVLRKYEEKMQGQGPKKCHSCGNQFQVKLLFRCRYGFCNQFFCYRCLFYKFSYQVQYLVAKRQYIWSQQLQLSKCPACRGLCSSKCESCARKVAQNKIQNSKIQFDDECHLCKRQKMPSIACSNKSCKQIFCQACYIKLQNVQTSKIQIIDWICPVCQNKCYCNLCQSARIVSKSEHISNLKPFQCNAQKNILQCKHPFFQPLQQQNIYNSQQPQQPNVGNISSHLYPKTMKESNNYQFNSRKSSEKHSFPSCFAEQNEQTSLARPSQPSVRPQKTQHCVAES